jgi:hypothetical protein
MTEDEVIEIIRDKARINMPDEKPEDIVTMSVLIAQKRSEARKREVSPNDMIFGAGVMCALFDWIKLSVYTDAARKCRDQFAGIAEDSDMKQRFRSLMTPELIGAASVPEAVGYGFDRLIQRSSDIRF